jgi:hypothetical protein
MTATRRTKIPDSGDLKRQLLDRAREVLGDEEMTTTFDDPTITVPTIVFDSDPTDDMEVVITIDPVVFDTDVTDD